MACASPAQGFALRAYRMTCSTAQELVVWPLQLPRFQGNRRAAAAEGQVGRPVPARPSLQGFSDSRRARRRRSRAMGPGFGGAPCTAAQGQLGGLNKPSLAYAMYQPDHCALRCRTAATHDSKDGGVWYCDASQGEFPVQLQACMQHTRPICASQCSCGDLLGRMQVTQRAPVVVTPHIAELEALFPIALHVAPRHRARPGRRRCWSSGVTLGALVAGRAGHGGGGGARGRAGGGAERGAGGADGGDGAAAPPEGRG